MLALALSFALQASGVFASSTVFFSGYTIPAWQGATTVSNKIKNDYSSEVIEIAATSYDRDIQFKIYDNVLGATAGYQTLPSDGSYVKYAIGREGPGVSALSASALFSGTKKLYLRTATNWLASTTTYSGSWWLSIVDWQNTYGPAVVSGTGFVGTIQ